MDQINHILYASYIGLSNRLLESRLKEHKTDDFNALKRHLMETDHGIAYIMVFKFWL